MVPTTTLTAADLALRPATLDDATFFADVLTAARPNDALDPVQMRHWWQSSDRENVVERFVAAHDDRPVGFAERRHAPWEKMPQRFSRLAAALLPEVLTAARLDALFALLEDRSRPDGTRTAYAWAWEDEALRLDVLRARGYEGKARQRFWELDLLANRERLATMAEESRARMREQGVRVDTLAGDPDPEKLRKVWRLSVEAVEQHGPLPIVPMTYEECLRWMGAPGLSHDRIWIARKGEEIVGISMLSYPPVRGAVFTDWTATARTVRGRGIARALKCETVLQAIALGVDRVRTDNSDTNPPILHINETMGYRVRAEMLQLFRAL